MRRDNAGAPEGTPEGNVTVIDGNDPNSIPTIEDINAGDDGDLGGMIDDLRGQPAVTPSSEPTAFDDDDEYNAALAETGAGAQDDAGAGDEPPIVIPAHTEAPAASPTAQNRATRIAARYDQAWEAEKQTLVDEGFGDAAIEARRRTHYLNAQMANAASATVSAAVACKVPLDTLAPIQDEIQDIIADVELSMQGTPESLRAATLLVINNRMAAGQDASDAIQVLQSLSGKPAQSAPSADQPQRQVAPPLAPTARTVTPSVSAPVRSQSSATPRTRLGRVASEIASEIGLPVEDTIHSLRGR